MTSDGDELDPLLTVEGLSAGFESQVIFRGVSFEVPRSGIVALMGPSGVGKTTLLRSLGRWNEALPSSWVHGRIWYEGRNLLEEADLEEVHRRAALLAQKARLYTATVAENAIADARGGAQLDLQAQRKLAREVLARVGLTEEFGDRLDDQVLSLSIARQRMLTIARLVGGGAAWLLADEPLRDIPEQEADELAVLLERVSQDRPIVMVTHNQRAAKRLCSLVVLMTAGRLVEVAPGSTFFTAPTTDLGREFVRSGNCWPLEGPKETVPDDPPDTEPTPAERVTRPGGFHWIIPQRLGGMQKPGLLRELQSDLVALRALAVRWMVTTTEDPLSNVPLADYGMQGIHFPIDDMCAPEPETTYALCERISAWVDAEEPVVVHCKAGLGRTGTILACALIHRGLDAVRAIEQVRCVNPRYIQSEEQLAFVSSYAQYCAEVRGG